MANDVFANGREVSCKSGSGKSICAFPDVCFTPPENPATPPGVPIPYPNTGMTSDTTGGSKTVKVTNKEVMLKNKSYFKKSTGDEAGCATKKGVVTSVNRGKVYFTAWSMDVKVEGKNAVRHLDLTTHNHASVPGNSPPWPYLDSQAFAGAGPCKDVATGVKDNCTSEDKHIARYKSGKKKGQVNRHASMGKMCADQECKSALKCVVSPYSPNNCCPDESGKKSTPHHIVPKSQFKEIGRGGTALPLINREATYDPNKAPCICVDGGSHSEGLHGEIHAETNTRTRTAVGVGKGKQIPANKRWTVGKAESIGSEAVEAATDGQCPKACTEAQVRKGHKEMKVRKDDKVRPTTAGGEPVETGSGF